MFTLKMETDNDAFSSSRAVEIARLLRRAATMLEQGRVSGNLMDYNGNTVGKWEIK